MISVKIQSKWYFSLWDLVNIWGFKILKWWWCCCWCFTWTRGRRRSWPPSFLVDRGPHTQFLFYMQSFFFCIPPFQICTPFFFHFFFDIFLYYFSNFYLFFFLHFYPLLSISRNMQHYIFFIFLYLFYLVYLSVISCIFFFFLLTCFIKFIFSIFISCIFILLTLFICCFYFLFF